MRIIDVRLAGRPPERIPAETGFAELDEMTAVYERLAAELREDEARVQARTAELEEARRDSLDRTAEAMISGGSKPKNGATLSSLEKKVAEAQETAEARVRALHRVGAEILSLKAEKAPEWARELERKWRWSSSTGKPRSTL